MKRRILTVLVALSFVVVLAPTAASASASICDYWANRFWAAMASNQPLEASYNYGQWAACTYHRMAGY
jgi:hypothetical protein